MLQAEKSKREKISSIFNRSNSQNTGLWIGNPHADTLDKYFNALRINSLDQLHRHFDDDCRWLCAEFKSYKHPDSKPLWDFYGSKEKQSLSQPGIFSEFTSVSQVESFDWPKVEYLDFSEIISQMKQLGDYAVFSGMWSQFFHVLCGFFGMEEYFVKMYTAPKMVEAATCHIIDFYLKANKKLFEHQEADFDIFFFGNDLGSQNDLLISVDMFKKFILPGIEKIVAQAKHYNKKVLFHSCGSIEKVIPLLIDIGIDGLHPLQAKANSMDLKTLATYKDKLAFVGGVDTQDLLVNGTSQEIQESVLKLKDFLGPNLVVSPSHEAILPNVSLDSIEAMVTAARKL
jgi:uroporphyrinogen decarboxylase